MKYGYIRCSTQNIENINFQKEALSKYNLDEIVIESSGSSDLDKLLFKLQPGDSLYVVSMSILSRYTTKIKNILEELKEKNIDLFVEGQKADINLNIIEAESCIAVEKVQMDIISTLKEKRNNMKDDRVYPIHSMSETQRICKCKEIVQEVAEKHNDDMINQIAMMYAKNLIMYGVDVTKEWETATQQSSSLEQAYIRGRKDERDRLAKLYEKYSDDWIPVSERLPEEGKEVLVWYEYFRYGDFNCMYQTYGIGYQFDGHWSGDVSGTKSRCIAWMHLPDKFSDN